MKRIDMSKVNEDRNPIDPELLEKIEMMRSTPERDAEIASQGRERYLIELESLPIAENKSLLAWLRIPLIFKSNKSKEFSMNSKTQKLALSTLFAIVFAFVLLFGGFSATAYASQTALPGDALFTVKTGLETTQVSLARDAYAKAQLQMRFAQRRLDEIIILLEQGRLKDVELASGEFEAYIQKALESLEIVMAGDPERGAELSNQISQTLLNYALALKNVLVNAPAAVKPAVEKAFLLSQDSAGDEIEVFGVVESISETDLVIAGETYIINDITEVEDLIEAGDTVKVHVIMTSHGAKIAREIEALSSLEDEFADDDDSADNANEEAGDENSIEDDDSANEDDGDENTNDDDANENDSDDNSIEDAIDDNHNEDDGNENNTNGGNDNDDDRGDDNSTDNINDSDDDNSNDSSGSDNDNNDNDHEEEDDGNDNEVDD
jgi:hypothetical protein